MFIVVHLGLVWVALMKGDKVKAYTSRQLKVHDKNYPTHELEFSTVLFALKFWRHYFYRVHVDVFTDHKSIQYVFTKRLVEPMSAEIVKVVEEL